MVEQSDSGGWFGLGMGLGILVGGFFTALILKSREPQPVQTQTMQPSAYLQPPQINLYPVIREQVEPRVQVQEKVQIAEPKPPVIEPITYKNNEKWVVERGEDGSIKSLNVVRDAKVNAST